MCPWCEQPIPHDKFSEISARIAQREGAHFTEMTTALKEQHVRDKEALEVKAKAELDRVRSEIQQAANAAMQERLAAVEQTRITNEAELFAKIAQAEENGARTKALLEQLQQENAVALEKVRHEAAEREAAIRQESQAAAEATVQERLAAVEQTRITNEAELLAKIAQAEENGAKTKVQLEQLQQENAASLEKVRQEAAEREAAIRQESQAAADAAIQERLAAVEQARVAKEAELQAKAATAEQQLQKLQEAH